MATDPHPLPDPVDDELERLLAEPSVQVRLDEFERRLADGRIDRVSADEVRRRLKLPREADPSPGG